MVVLVSFWHVRHWRCVVVGMIAPPRLLLQTGNLYRSHDGMPMTASGADCGFHRGLSLVPSGPKTRAARASYHVGRGKLGSGERTRAPLARGTGKAVGHGGGRGRRLWLCRAQLSHVPGATRPGP